MSRLLLFLVLLVLVAGVPVGAQLEVPPAVEGYTVRVWVSAPGVEAGNWSFQCPDGGLLIVEAAGGSVVEVRVEVLGSPGREALECANKSLTSLGLDWAVPVVARALEAGGGVEPLVASQTIVESGTNTPTTNLVVTETGLGAEAPGAAAGLAGQSEAPAATGGWDPAVRAGLVLGVALALGAAAFLVGRRL